MYFLYKISIRIYYFLIRLIAPIHPRAEEWVKGRNDQQKESFQKIPADQSVIWFHASSLGEFEQALPIIKEWKTKKPDDFILLTFYSPSGYKQIKNYSGIDRVMYLPRDITNEVRIFLDQFNPDRLLLIKYDIWPVLLKELANRKIPFYLVSAVFRPNQLFFKWYGHWYLSILKRFTGIFVQDQASAQLLKKNGVNQVMITGDTRIDRVADLASENYTIEGIDSFVGDNRIIRAGSSWQKEENFLNRFFSENKLPDVKLILAPHDVSSKHLTTIQKQFGSSLIFYSQLLTNPATGLNKKVLLIDRIGLLSKLYRYGQIAVIGGAFGAGLHNILEPAVFGIPIIFGPRFQKYIEAVELVRCKAGFSVKSYEEFQSILRLLLEDKNTLFNAGKGCRLYVDNSKGATSLIIRRLLEKT